MKKRKTVIRLIRLSENTKKIQNYRKTKEGATHYELLLRLYVS